MPNLSPLKFGAYHMIGQDAWEPQRTNNFELRFPNLPQLYSIDTGIAMPANSSDYLTLSLKSADTVNITINSINIHIVSLKLLYKINLLKKILL